MSNENLILQVSYTPHTTVKDAEFVINDLNEFNPHFFIPAELGRSYNGLKKLQRHYGELIEGKKELSEKRPFYDFHKRLTDELRKYNESNGIRFYFLEAHQKEEARKIGRKHEEEINHKKKAWEHFDENEIDKACDELYQALILHARNGKTRAESIETNAKKLGEYLVYEYPDFANKEKIKLHAWLSDIYSPPVIDFKGCIPNFIESYQKLPYVQLTYVEAVRNLILGKEISQEDLSVCFAENIIEEKLRTEIPNSIERFELCRNISKELEYDYKISDVEELLKSVRIDVKI